MNANPSPGNKAGGLTTILEKSLGAMAKAGNTNLVDVVRYAEEVKARGFVFMDTLGYYPLAATGQVVGGANLVCFTTGRGSMFGCKPAPSIKLATNTAMFKHIEDYMDVNCGTILDGDETVQHAGQRIFELILRVASGERTKSELFDFGAAEFRPVGTWRNYVGAHRESTATDAPRRQGRRQISAAPAWREVSRGAEPKIGRSLSFRPFVSWWDREQIRRLLVEGDVRHQFEMMDIATEHTLVVLASHHHTAVREPVGAGGV
jgi:hypothetical protein